MKKWHNWVAVCALGLGLSCNQDAKAPDITPPVFQGATSATVLADGVVLVSWEPATDGGSPSERIMYRVYVGVGDERIDFTRHQVAAPAGATSIGVPGLPQGHTVRLVVRATDQAGNEDENKRAVEVSLPDRRPPQFAGVENVVGLSSSAIEVRWSAATGPRQIDKYLVYLSDDELPFQQEPLEIPSSQTATVFENLDEAKTYFAGVRAVDAAGKHDGNRKVLSTSTLDHSPPRFDGLHSLTVGGTALLVRWLPAQDNVTEPADIVYRIYSAPSPEELDFDTPLTSVKGSTYLALKDLEPSTNYYFTVRAVDEAGNEDKNTLFDSVLTSDAPDSIAPVFGGATGAEETSASTIRVSWDPANDDLTSTDAIRYDVWYSTRPGGQALLSSPQVTSSPGATSIDVSGLAAGTTYYFVVRARDLQDLNDDNTVEVSATTKIDDTPPIFGGVSSVVGLNATTLRVSWLSAADDTAPPNAITYDVYMASSSGAQNFDTPTTSVTGATSVEMTGLPRETTYYVVVHARNPEGNVNASDVELSGATLPDTTGPVLDSPPLVSALSDDSLQVSWASAVDDSYPSDELIYTVYYSTSSGGPYEEGPTTAPNVTNAVLDDLETNKQYFVVVRGRDPSGNWGDDSPEGSAQTSDDITPPSFATGATTLKASTYKITINLNLHLWFNSVTVEWPEATDNVSSSSNIYYELCYATTAAACTGGAFTVSATTAPAATSHTFSGLTLGTKYWFSVRAVDEAGNRSPPRTPVSDGTGPATPSMPTIAASGANINVTWTTTADAVFAGTPLRYQIQYNNGCTDGFVTHTTVGPTSTGGTTTVKGAYGGNRARVVAIDGFGNQTASPESNTVNLTASPVLQPLWSASCNLGGCHGGPNGGYAQWTVTTARQSPSPVGIAGAVVVPGNTSTGSSRMYNRITRVDGLRMPPGGPTPTDLVCNLRLWIQAGAP